MSAQKIYDFKYSIGDDEGFCSAISFAQARDRALVDCLRRRGITPRDPLFAWKKFRLRESHPLEVHILPIYLKRFQELYRCMKENQCLPNEVLEFKQLSKIFREEKSYDNK